ncbi:MAG: iron ABC transporter permease [Pseudanabaenaceae cyanobacterium bins.68]|nr:iron ABC transporter permease [Pseudanabaenaceae cyanobacterium bins.68]
MPTGFLPLLFLIPLISLIAAPILVVIASFAVDASGVWQHLWNTVLAEYVVNTLTLVAGVGVGVGLLGVTTGWLVAMCDFGGKGWLEWLLLLPLAAPAYILAYIYTDALEYYGIFQRMLRALFGWQSASDYWFPPIRNLGGAIAMLILVLYPYVYLLTRVAFLRQGAAILEASRVLGCNPWGSFWRVALPLARPAIAGGMALAIMEALNDYGTVQFFGVNTFTVGIYRTWFNLGDRPASMQLAALLVLFALVFILLESWSRQNQRFNQDLGRVGQVYSLKGWRAVAAILVCAIPVILGFILPTGLLIHLYVTTATDYTNHNFIDLSLNSLVLAGTAAMIGAAIALVLAYLQRNFSDPLVNSGVRLAAMGYGIPGAVIAVGILIPLGYLDNLVGQVSEAWLGVSPGLIFSGTILAIVYAYLVRFLSVTLNAVESSLGQVKPSLDEAARILGTGNFGIVTRIHLPIVWSGILAGMIFLFVDALKELPATIVLRPANFETLAVRVYQYASDERLAEAALPALTILAVGILPVFLLSWRITRR